MNPMQNRLKFAQYNDGIAYIYRDKGKRSNFGAKINAVTLDDLDYVAKLAYAEQSKRLQDMEYAEQMGFSLEMKIKTRFIQGIDNKCKVVINGYLYDIRHIDTTKTEIYFYMEGVGTIAGAD